MRLGRFSAFAVTKTSPPTPTVVELFWLSPRRALTTLRSNRNAIEKPNWFLLRNTLGFLDLLHIFWWTLFKALSCKACVISPLKVPVELVPVLRAAIMPSSAVVSREPRGIGTGPFVCEAETLKLPPTFALPSNQALVSPLSILAAMAKPDLPSPPPLAKALVMLRSIVLACNNRSPPTMKLLSSWRCTLESVTSTDVAIPRCGFLFVATRTAASLSDWNIASPPEVTETFPTLIIE